MLNEFNLPIYYNIHKQPLKKSIQEDLEMIEYKSEPKSSLYYTLSQPQSVFGKTILKKFKDYYTTDIDFLKDYQKLIVNFENIKQLNHTDLDKVKDIWYDITGRDIENDVKITELQKNSHRSGFLEKYNFVDWDYLEILNHNGEFLQLMSVYNLISPVLSLVLPIVLLIVPFFLLKLQGIQVTFSKYIEVLKKILVAIPLGQILRLKEMSWDKRVYAIVTCCFYLFQIYQNCLFCYKFHRNLYKMHEYLKIFKEYLIATEIKMNEFLSKSNDLESFRAFNTTLKTYTSGVSGLKNKLLDLTEYCLKPKNIMEIGKAMKLFYEFHCDSYVRSTMEYTFGFNGFIENMCCIYSQYKNKDISFCKFSDKTCKMKQAFFAPLKNNTHIKNDISLKKNMIITGPNASGKTTLLKTALFNIIISQQIGFGFYTEASITPFKYIQCYLNIPDTSSRDSLFQAEARRCKEIIDCLKDSDSTEKHFCIFDELYSGTNPEEAVKSANAYLHYLSKQPNLKFMLTTHYLDVCNSVDTKKIINYNMKIIEENNEFNYTYNLEKGISNVKGGLKVLRDLEYPSEILEYVKREN